MTAWVGLFRVARLKEGETVFISAGAGAVGSAACQLAKMRGCRVIASAGSADKVAFLRDELKVECAFNYRDGEPLDHLKKGAPKGSTSTSTTPAVPNLKPRCMFCELWQGRPVRRNRRLQHSGARPAQPDARRSASACELRAFIVSDHFRDSSRFSGRSGPRPQIRKARQPRDLVEGLDAAPAALLDILHSGAGNIGKMIVKLSE